MMKLVIKNELEHGGLYHDFYDPNTGKFVKKRRIEPYDEEKWKDGSVYEFNTLKEMCDFIDSCDIDFTEDYEEYEHFNSWYWEEIDIDYYIDKSEDNLMILLISSHAEFRE